MWKKIIIFFVMAVVMTTPMIATQTVSAQFGLDKTADKAGYETTGASASIPDRIQLIVSIVLGLVALIFFVLTLYSGLIWLTAGGKEGQTEKAKGVLEAAIIGLVIVSASYAISTFILTRLESSV